MVGTFVLSDRDLDGQTLVILKGGTRRFFVIKSPTFPFFAVQLASATVSQMGALEGRPVKLECGAPVRVAER